MTINERFELFWRAYPKKVGKFAAQKAFIKLAATEQAEILTHIPERLATDPQWIKNSGQFIPHPATFLNQGRWMDEWETAGPEVVEKRSYRQMEDGELIHECNRLGIATHGRTRFELIVKLEGKKS